MTSDTVTLREAAERLALPVNTLRNASKQGRGPEFHERTATHTNYFTDEIERWLDTDEGRTYSPRWYGLTATREDVPDQEDNFLLDHWDAMAAATRTWHWYVTFATFNEDYSSPCLVWSGPDQVFSGGRNWSPRSLSYRVAYPDIEAGAVEPACGNWHCINPEHLTCQSWGVREDFLHLVKSGASPTRISDALSLTREELLRRSYDWAEDPEAAWLVTSYQVAVYEADIRAAEHAEGQASNQTLGALNNALDRLSTLRAA